jgi:hypothetical protein
MVNFLIHKNLMQYRERLVADTDQTHLRAAKATTLAYKTIFTDDEIVKFQDHQRGDPSWDVPDDRYDLWCAQNGLISMIYIYQILIIAYRNTLDNRYRERIRGKLRRFIK